MSALEEYEAVVRPALARLDRDIARGIDPREAWATYKAVEQQALTEYFCKEREA